MTCCPGTDGFADEATAVWVAVCGVASTDTVASSSWVTYTVPVSGSTAITSGLSPAGMVAVTVLVAASISDMLLPLIT